MKRAFIRPFMAGHRAFTTPLVMFRRPSVSAASVTTPPVTLHNASPVEARSGGKVLR